MTVVRKASQSGTSLDSGGPLTDDIMRCLSFLVFDSSSVCDTTPLLYRCMAPVASASDAASAATDSSSSAAEADDAPALPATSTAATCGSYNTQQIK